MAVPNKKSIRKPSDYGVRVARPGYDAGFCAQNQLLFNSNWPILQICGLMKVSDMPTVNGYEMMETTTIYNTSTTPNTVISSQTVVYEVSSVPSGYARSSTYYWTADYIGGEYATLRANKKYIEKMIAGNRTTYGWNPSETTSGNRKTVVEKSCEYFPRKRKSHRLGFTPFFMDSSDISSTAGYVVLFSVDIANDVDYPYTEEALAMLSPTVDYGIKSSSIFPRVDGLCSNMFSKLVQAIKTEKTVADASNVDKGAVWSPVKAEGSAKDNCLLPYEFYGFLGNTWTDAGIDGGCYYRRQPVYYVPKTGEESATSMSKYWAVSNSAMAVLTTKNSLVVVRSPMVSPEYEERTVS